MALIRYTNEALFSVEETTFEAEGIREREDLQRLLIESIDIIAPEVLVIDEEFSEWQDNTRRIDLLCLDKAADLVVIELKRTVDGGHMELQSLRYAAMVSTFTFDGIADAFAESLKRRGKDADARGTLLDFLSWEEPKEEDFANDVRIILVAADFSSEVTSTVLWLNDHDLDIRCVRLKPYKLNDQVLIDAQQIIPLPDASDYQVQVKRKEQIRKSKAWRPNSPEHIWAEFEEKCSPEVLKVAKTLSSWAIKNGFMFEPLTQGFTIYAKRAELRHFLFEFHTTGTIYLLFQYFQKYKEFSSDEVRSDLIQRANEIPGVNIGEEHLTGRPKLLMQSLADEQAMVKFQDFILWVASHTK